MNQFQDELNSIVEEKNGITFWYLCFDFRPDLLRSRLVVGCSLRASTDYA